MDNTISSRIAYCMAILVIISVGTHAQSTEECNCDGSNSYCASIDTVVTVLRLAADRANQAAAQANALALTDPQFAAEYLAIAAQLHAAALTLRTIALAESATCTADICCRKCCKSFYEGIENIFNPDAPLLNGTLLTLTLVGCNARSVSLESTIGCIHRVSVTHTKKFSDFDETYSVCRAFNSEKISKKSSPVACTFAEIQPER
jgi:hypothetical protein